MPDIPEKHKFLEKILKLAGEKPEFREKLLKSPKEAIQSMVTFTLPEDFEIAVHEDTPSKVNIILPNTSDELSEVELSAVSGGCGWLGGSSPDPGKNTSCGGL